MASEQPAEANAPSRQSALSHIKDMLKLVLDWLIKSRNPCARISSGLVVAGLIGLGLPDWRIVLLILAGTRLKPDAYVPAILSETTSALWQNLASGLVIAAGLAAAAFCIRKAYPKGVLTLEPIRGRGEYVRLASTADEGSNDPRMCFRLRLHLHVRHQKLVFMRFAVDRYKDGLPCTRSNPELRLDGQFYYLSGGTTLDPVPILESRTYDLDYRAEFSPSLADTYSAHELEGEGELRVEIGYRFESDAYERDLIVRHFKHVASPDLAHDYVLIAELSPPPFLNDEVLAAAVRKGKITKADEAFAKTIPATSRFAVVRSGHPLYSDDRPMIPDEIARLQNIHRRIQA